MCNDGAIGITCPLHNGQWLPHPAPDPVARTIAPQTITSTLYPTTPHANRSATSRDRSQPVRPHVAAATVAIATFYESKPAGARPHQQPRLPSAFQFIVSHLSAPGSRHPSRPRDTLYGVRIASLQPSVSITLAALGRLDDLCACTRYCLEALPELTSRNLPVLHDSWSFGAQPHDLKADSSALLAAKPDLLIASVPYRMETLAAILRSGHPVLALAPHTLSDIFTDIRLLASVTHATSAADTLIASMQATLHGTRTYTATSAAQPLVYCEEWGKPLIHSQTWVAELVATANGRFLGTPGAHTTSDEIAAADPDVIILAWCGAGIRVPLDKVIAQRHWQHLRAVRSRRIHVIPDEYLNTPAPTLLKGLACLASALHPELYPPHPDLVTLSG